MSTDFTIKDINDIEKIEEIPLEERISENNTLELIENGASINPEGIAISFLRDGDSYDRPQRITYSQFIHKIKQTANMLHDLGVGESDVVTYVLPNLPETHYVLWGAEAAGIANPVNPLLEAETIKDICRAAETKVLVALADMPGIDIWQKVDKIRKDIPSLRYVVLVWGESNEQEGIYGFEEKIKEYSGDRLTFERQIEAGDIASIYHTGGTTGRPKLAMRTHWNEVAVSWDLKVMSGLKPQETIMVGLPLFHCNGTIVTGLMPFSVGGEVVILSPNGFRDPSIIRNFFQIVEYYRPVFFSCVPTVLSMLLDVPVDNADISSLRYLICGAAPLSVELFRRFEAHSGIKILEGYGLTEVAVASCTNPKDGKQKIGSVGIRHPYQKVKVVILDERNEYVRDADINEIGVVCIKGPCVFKGYLEEEHNKGIWVQGEWFNTGDMGRIDEDGYLFLTGRQKELIIRGGHNIDPAMIEEPLYQMPSVKMVAAVGQPDSYAGEVPVAYVELAEGANVKEEDIKRFAEENIGEKAAIPKEIHITDQIPLTPVGKVFKPALRRLSIKNIFEQELEQIEELNGRFSVSVEEDKLHGTKANIIVQSNADIDQEFIKDNIAKRASGYALHYEIHFE